jgi:predicted transglutaminase-like cysteine proteinase
MGILLGAIMLISASWVIAGVIDFSPGLLSYVSSKWGDRAVDRLHDWHDTVQDRQKDRQKSTPAPVPTDDLQAINRFLNKVPYYSDKRHWGVDDYWATPVEMLSSNGGDCEDYAIAKYFSLKELGIPVENLRISYVRALKLNEAHMVLAFYSRPDSDPYILDNLTGRLVPASERPDLEPIYSFNDEDLWAAGAANFKGKSSQIRLWSELLDKMQKERAM